MSERQKGQLWGAAAVGGALIALVAACILVYALSNTSLEDARLWALVATVAILPTALVGYWLGKTESRGVVTGLDKGMDQVMKAADQTAKLRVNVLHATRPRPPEPPTIITLPQEPTFQDPPRLLSGEVVEM